jgi:hypothetical protein
MAFIMRVNEMGMTCGTLVGEKRNACGVLVGKPAGKILLGKCTSRSDDSTQKDLREVRRNLLQWICVAQYRSICEALLNAL